MEIFHLFLMYRFNKCMCVDGLKRNVVRDL